MRGPGTHNNGEHNRAGHQDGFVLPYVLVTIAVMSIFMSMVAVRLMDVADTTRAFVADADADIALASLEAEALYTLLTAVPVEGGLAILAGRPAQISGPLGSLEGLEDKPLIGGTGTRLFSPDIAGAYMDYQDVTGLVPANGQNLVVVSRYLQASGLKPEMSRSLAAKLSDYTDEDEGRIFRGAERADYNLRDMSPPTNHALRHHRELSSVLGWQEAIDEIGFWTLYDEMSVHPQNSAFNAAFIPSALRAKLDSGLLGRERQEMIAADAELSLGLRTSNYWRIMLSVPAGEGRVRVRALDVDRKLGALNEPFATNLVYERVMRKEASDSAANE